MLVDRSQLTAAKTLPLPPPNHHLPAINTGHGRGNGYLFMPPGYQLLHPFGVGDPWHAGNLLF